MAREIKTAAAANPQSPVENYTQHTIIVQYVSGIFLKHLI